MNNIPNSFIEKKPRDHYTSLVTHMYFTSNLYVGACELKSVLPKLKRNEHVVIFNFYLTIVTIKTPIFLAEHCMPHLHEHVTLDANHM